MKLVLIGYGKMGKEIERLANEQGHVVHAIVTKSDDSNSAFNKLQGADVAIEFSTPDAAVDNLLTCFKAGVNVVCGTTGWTKRMPEITAACSEANGGFFYASNFSIGVNIFFELNRRLAELMHNQSEYQVSMEEIHHLQKKDAPSGTALTLAKSILENKPELQGIDNNIRFDAIQTFDTLPNLLPIVSTRIENVTGTHEITYASELDRISIKHEAHSRLAFAKGVLMAAQWMQGKQGIFGMQDLLKIS